MFRELASRQVFVGLGGNVGTDAEILARFERALTALTACAAGDVRRSPIYRSAPYGPITDQPPFLNAVATFEAEPFLDPEQLLARLLEIEEALGRQRSVPMGPRAIDLDLLLFGQLEYRSSTLELPHPGMLERSFVLRPLADLLGRDATLLSGETLEQLLCLDSQLLAALEPADVLSVFARDDRGDDQSA